jgi:hypothetical protein
MLLAVARHPEATVAEVARAARITEGSAFRMLADSSTRDTRDAEGWSPQQLDAEDLARTRIQRGLPMSRPRPRSKIMAERN